MKVLINSILAIVVVLALSCTEEVITLLKEHSIDTVYVTDTVFITNTDTVTIDSIICIIHDSITVVRDTVVLVKTDTVYLTIWSVYIYYQNYVDKFYDDAKHYGWTDLQKNNLILKPWEIAEIQNDGYPQWYLDLGGTGTSISYQENKQWYAKINALMRNEAHYIAIYRELGHVLLGKPYAPKGADEIMGIDFSPFSFTDRPYDSTRARTYLNKLFEK